MYIFTQFTVINTVNLFSTLKTPLGYKENFYELQLKIKYNTKKVNKIAGKLRLIYITLQNFIIFFAYKS